MSNHRQNAVNAIECLISANEYMSKAIEYADHIEPEDRVHYLEHCRREIEVNANAIATLAQKYGIEVL